MKPLILSLLFPLISLTAVRAAEPPGRAAPPSVKVATFDVDATPPLGSAMAYDPVRRLDELTLRCRGVVLVGAGKPVVLCAVGWIGIANEGHGYFREKLADAAGATPDRVAVHTLHQHDAPGCDFTAERLVRDLGLKDFGRFESARPPPIPRAGTKPARGPATWRRTSSPSWWAPCSGFSERGTETGGTIRPGCSVSARQTGRPRHAAFAPVRPVRLRESRSAPA